MLKEEYAYDSISTGFAWIGGYEDGSEWKWTSREEWTYSNFSSEGWGGAAAMIADGTWTTSPDGWDATGYIIEWDQ